MPKYSMIGPDGKTYLMEAPEGVTPEQVRQRLRQRISERIAATPTPAPTQRQAPQRTPPTYSRVDQERNEINRLQTQYTRQLQEAQRELETITAGRDPRAVRDATIRQRGRINEAERQLAALRGRRTFLEEQGRPIPEISMGEKIGDVLAGIPRGAIRGVTSVPSILGIFGEAGEDIGRGAEEAGESAIRGLGLEQSEDVRTAMQYGTDPVLAQTSAFGEGLGSVVPFIGTSVFGAAAKGLAVAKNLDRTAKVVAGATAGTQAVLGSGMGSAEARRRMDAWEEETGETLNPWTRRLVNFTGGAIGLSETLPINSLLNRLPGPVRQRFNKKLTDIISGAANKTEAVAGIRNFLSKATKYMDSSVLGRMTLRGFAPEAAQEGFAELSQNILQLSAYDPEQEVLEGVGESALLGGFVGKTVRGGAEATGAVVNKLRRMNAATVDTLEQARSEDPVSFDIIERDKQDPSKQIRQTIQVIAMEGDTATILRPDGTQAQLSLEALERRIAPDEGYEGFSTPEEFSSSNILGRLESSIGDIEDADAPALNRYITGVNSAISKALAFGNPREAVEYISQLETRFARAKGRKAKTTESKADIAMQNVLKEARSIVTDYQVEYAKSRAQPGAQVGAPATTEESAQIAQEESKALEEKDIRLNTEERAKRSALLEEARQQPYNPDNPYGIFSWFDTQLRENGFGGATTEEALALRDMLRFEFELESADTATEAQRARDVMRERLNIIEPILRDNSIADNQKAAAIDAALKQDGRPKLTKEEARVVFGRAIANSIFGPGGRMDQQRRAILERIRMDDSIPLRNKIREFNAALEQVPELSGLEPTAEEIALLTGEEVQQKAKTSRLAALQESLRLRQQEQAARNDILQQAIIQPISEDPMAKFSFFEEQLRINGFSEPTFEETSTLRDQYRYESGIESADLSTEARRARDVMRERLNIIEPILRDNSIPNDQKGPAIDAALAQDGRPSMTEDEATIVFGRAIANDIFGPGGRMDQQRRDILERIRMDDSIPLRNKIREFNAALEQVPELAGLEPTAEEIALLTSEETTQDAPTQTTRDVKTSDTRRVEPSVPAPDEGPAAKRDATQQSKESDRRGVDADSTDASGDTQRGREPEPTLTPEGKTAFIELADAQLEGPEKVMIDLQNALKSTILSYVAENVGDLTRRMSSERDQRMDFGRESVLEKTNKTLALLKSRYGFARDLEDDISSNIRFFKLDEQQYRDGIDVALANYADSHAKLPVYNRAQQLARDAAVLLGRKDYAGAVNLLEGLRALAKRDSWTKVAGSYDPNFEQTAPVTKETAPKKLSIKSVKQRRTVDQGTFYEVELSDGKVATIYRDTDQFGPSNPVWYIDPESVGVKRADLPAMGMPDRLGATKKEALEALPEWIESNTPATRRAPPVPEAAPEVAPEAKFSGTIEGLRHGSANPNLRIVNPVELKDTSRYDGNVFGNRGMYLAADPKWLGGEGAGRFATPYVYDVSTTFDNAFVLSPNTLATFVDIVGVSDNDFLPLGHTIDRLKSVGFDGLVVEGFDALKSWETVEKAEEKKLKPILKKARELNIPPRDVPGYTKAQEEAYRDAARSLFGTTLDSVPEAYLERYIGDLQDQIVAFYPERAVSIESDARKYDDNNPEAFSAMETVRVRTKDVPQAPEVQEETVHSKLNENEKKRLAKHYGRKTYDEVAKRQFIQDFSNAVTNGINTVAEAIRGIIRRIQKSALAKAIVFAPATLIATTPSDVSATLEIAPAKVFKVSDQSLIPPETLAVMSSQAQATYEALAPAATSAGRPFMIADKPNGRLFIFGKDGVLHQETVAIYGRDEGDILSQQRLDAQSYEDLRASGGLQVTPSGVFDFRVVDNPKYPGQKVLALTSTDKTRRVGIGEREGAGVFVALHGNTVTTEARQRALASGDAEQSKQSMGCIVTSPEFFAQHIATDIDSISDAVVAIVPDVEANLDPVLAAAQTLSRRSDRLISRLQDAQTAQGVDIVAEPTLESTTADSPNISKPQMFGAIADLMDYIKKKFPTKSTLIRKLNYKYQDANDYAKALAGAYGVSIGEISPDMSIDRRFELFESRKTGNQMEVQRRFFRPIINLLKELDVNPDDVGLYLWARSAKDRNALIRERNASMPDGGSGLTNAEAELVIQSLEEAENGTLLPKIKKVVALHDRLVKYALKIRVDAGLLTQKQADAALEKQPFYTPLKGYATDGDMQLLGELELDGEGRYKEDLDGKGSAKIKAAVRKLRLGARPQEFYKAEGRTSIPLNPLFNLFADVQQVIMHAEKNRVSQSLLFNLLYYPEEHENIAQVYRDTDKVIRTEPSRDIAYPDGTPIRGNLGELAIKGEVLVVKVDKQTKKALNAKGISVSEGQTFFIQFKDTEAGQAIQRAFINMTPKQVNAFLRYSRNAAQGLKSMLTRYSPIYLYGTAYLRDTQDAIFTAYTSQVDPSSPAKGKKIAKDMRKYLMPTTGSRRIPFTETYITSPAMSPLTGAIKNFITGRPPQSKDEVAFMAALQEMIEEGGSVGHAMIASAETLAADAKAELQTYANMRKRNKFNLKKYGSGANYLRQGAAKALDATAQTIDLNARLATYLAAKENGLTKEEAALLALDSSLNLTRRGEWADLLDTLYFFTSPTIESGRKIYRQGVRGGAKFLRRVFYLGVLSAIWNSIFGAGDEDDDGESNYQEVPPYIKQTRLVMFYGAGQNDYISIPMGFLLALPKYLGEVTTETALGVLSSPEEAGSLIVDGIGKSGAGTVNALSPIRGEVTDLSSAAQTVVPNIVRPVYDLFVNSNYFRSPIYRSQSEFDNRPASSLGKPGTPEIYSNFAKFMNAATGGGSRTSGIVDFQPEVYRYLATQYTGGLGRIADLALAKGIDPEKSLVEQLPVLNTFVGRGAEYNPMNEYYELTGPRKGAPALDIIYKDFAGENATLTSQREIIREYGSKAPHLFDSRLLDAFNYAQGELDRLYKDRREELDRAGGDYEAKRRIRNKYMRQTSAIQSRFNNIYRIIEKEY